MQAAYRNQLQLQQQQQQYLQQLASAVQIGGFPGVGAGYVIPNPGVGAATQEQYLALNLTAAAQLSRFAIQHFQRNLADSDGVRGRLVHVASRAAYRGDSPDHWHYAAAKGGMVAMHKTIARAYGAEGILSFAVTPGFTDTAMAGDYLDSRGGAGLLADIPLGRVANPEEIAQIVTFCALDAPASMTGAVIDANGASFVR